MSNIWLISDTHFNHNQSFLYEPRGFVSVKEMNESIIERWNSLVKPEDTVYHLGDVIMGDLDAGLQFVKSLNGHIKLALGNHDTPQRVAAFSEFFDEIQFGYRLKVGKKVLYLSHYPMLTGNFDNSKVYSIHGHTHNKEKFNPEYELMFNVCCDAINCMPLPLTLAIDMINQNQENRIKKLKILDKLD